MNLRFPPFAVVPVGLVAALVLTQGCPSQATAGVGATTPFVTCEAESATLEGKAAVRSLAQPADDARSSPELEASGRAFVELKAEGDALTWINRTGKPVTALDVRYSIPDAPAGGGIEASLDLWVDGIFRQAISLSSRQIWLYDEPPGNKGDRWNGMGQDPTLGNPHVFFEEAQCRVVGASIAPGGKLTLRKDASNTAAFYWIDLIDLEEPPPPIPQPADSLSIADCGAVATPDFSGPLPQNAPDCSAAIQQCINAARAQKKSVWIPPGRFVFSKNLSAQDVAIQGAGMWHSKLYRNLPLPATHYEGAAIDATSCTLRDFFLDANATSRRQIDGCWGGVDAQGDDWLVDGLWIEHTSSGVWARGNRGVVRNCRVLSAWGDGVNLNNGNHGNKEKVGNQLLAENNYVRGVGDDGVTINSDITATQMDTVTLRHNTTVAVWWADGLRVAGGKNLFIQDNLLIDPVKFPGIIVGTFNGQPVESAIVEGNVIIRGGGNAYNQRKAAVEVGPGDPYVKNVTVRNNVIRDSIENAVKVQSSENVIFENNVIDTIFEGLAPKRRGIGLHIAAGAAGSGVFVRNVIKNVAAGQSAYRNDASSESYSIKGSDNVGFEAGKAVP